MPTLSIIVPVFNGEHFIEKCVDSILLQTYIDFELILVDDGSTDNTLNICNRYKNKDDRVVVINQNNSGALAARRKGVMFAQGEYVGFVDCDDYIAPDMYNELMSVIVKDESDIVMSGLVLEYNKISKTLLNAFPTGKYNKNQITELIIPKMLIYSNLLNYGIIPGIVLKVFKRSILNKVFSNIDENVSIGDDVIVTFNSVVESNNISIVDYAGYHYVQNENSMIHKYDYNRINKVKIFYEAAKRTGNSIFLNQVNVYIMIQIFDTIGSVVRNSCLSLSNKIKEINRILNYKWVVEALKQINYSGNLFKTKLKIFMMKQKCSIALYLLLSK